MRFIKVRWNHAHCDEPRLIYQEVNDGSRETRKVELFKDGTLCGYASMAQEVGNSIVSDQPIPSIEVINESSEFDAQSITQDEFEQVWTWAMDACGPLE